MVNFHTLDNVNKLQAIFSKSSITRKFAIFLENCMKKDHQYYTSKKLAGNIERYAVLPIICIKSYLTFKVKLC